MRVLDLLPARTTLLPIEPINPESSTRESLSSYFRRLCAANGLRVSRVFSMLILPCLSGASPSVKRSGYPAYDYRWVNGNGKSSTEWTEILETLTRSNGLRRLTLLDWSERSAKSIVLLERHRKWCPTCYQQAVDRGEPVYDQLAWTIRGFDCCPEHGVPLENICPHCHKGPFHYLTGNDVAGFCPHCHKWLGSHTEVSRDRHGNVDTYSLWTAQSIASFLVSDGLVHDVSDTDRFAAINLLIDKHFAGSLTETGRLLGRSKAVIFGWRHGKRLPCWEAWCQLSYCFTIPMRNLISGDIGGLTLPSPRELPQPRATTRRKPKRRCWEKIGRFLREVAKENPLRFDSMVAVARHLGLHARQLHHHFPKESAALSKYLTAQRKRERALTREKKRLALMTDIHEAIDLLRRHDQHPTRRNVERVLSIRKIKINRNKSRLLAQCIKSAQIESCVSTQKSHVA